MCNDERFVLLAKASFSSALTSRLKVWLEFLAGYGLELWQGLTLVTSKFAFPSGPHSNRQTFQGLSALRSCGLSQILKLLPQELLTSLLVSKQK